MKFPSIVPHYSRKIFLYASFLLLVLAASQPVLAAEDYTATDVVVDADGRDATEARAKALAQAQKAAFAQLIKRLNPGDADYITAKTQPAEILPMVRSFSVVEEKMTAEHYHAVLNYHFDPKQIQQLVPAQIPPSAPAVSPAPASVAAPVAAPATPPTATVPPQPAAPIVAPSPVTPAVPAMPAVIPSAPVHIPENGRKAVLVLPVYNDNGTLMLWQDENKWRNVWYEAALEASGGLVVVPLGDINDRVDVDDTNVNAATTQTLRRLYDRYGVGQIFVASAFYNLKADPKPALEVSMRRLLPEGKTETITSSYTIRTTETPDALLLRASREIAHGLYKQQTIDPGKIEYDRLKEITARLNTTDIKEWKTLRQRLLTRGNIVDVKFISISYYETVMTISYKGTSDLLGKTLVAAGLRVLVDGNQLVLSLQ